MKELLVPGNGKWMNQSQKLGPKLQEPAPLSVRSLPKKRGTDHGPKASATGLLRGSRGQIKGLYFSDKMHECVLTNDTQSLEQAGELGTDDTQGRADAQTAEASVRTAMN